MSDNEHFAQIQSFSDGVGAKSRERAGTRGKANGDAATQRACNREGMPSLDRIELCWGGTAKLQSSAQVSEPVDHI